MVCVADQWVSGVTISFCFMYVSPFVGVTIAFSEGSAWSIRGTWGIAVMYSRSFRLHGCWFKAIPGVSRSWIAVMRLDGEGGFGTRGLRPDCASLTMILSNMYPFRYLVLLQLAGFDSRSPTAGRRRPDQTPSTSNE
jgi:hypothetical protein